MSTKDSETTSSTPPQFTEDKIKISLDLVDASRKQLEFLKTIDKCPQLHATPIIQNAIRRYEQFWLPLAAEVEGKDMAPPLDVHWVWHCHMLAPYFYEKDCLAIINKVVEHKLMSEYVRVAAQCRGRKLWEERYKEETFDYDYDEYILNNRDSEEDAYQQKCKYTLVEAAARQRMFYYQVSLPHYRMSQFLVKALQRYMKFLFLKKNNPDLFLVPCYDFDLIWHSHQLHPLSYKIDTLAIIGKLFNHDDSVNDRSPDAKLKRSDGTTRELWKKFFGEEFPLAGAMFRGDAPFGKLEGIGHDQVFAISSKSAEVTINSLKIENFSDDQKFTLKVALSGRQQAGPTLLKLKGPQKEWENNGKGITKFTFDTGHHSLLQFDLVDKKGFLCFGTNQSFGIHNYPFSQVIENTPSNGQTVNQTLPLLEGGTGPANGLRVAFVASVQPPQKGPCILMLQAGPFQTYTMPENIEQLWGPISLPRLPEGIPNTCIVASHRSVHRIVAMLN